MKIVIGHLFPKLLNLYGDSGNIKAIKYNLEKLGIEAEVIEIDDCANVDFDSINVLYIGSGTEDNRKLVIDMLFNYKDVIEAFINDNKVFIATGNSMAIFGEKIISTNDSEIKCLGIFDYYEQEQENRRVKEVVCKNNILKKDIYGFLNTYGLLIGNDSILFNKDGFTKHNFYATYIIGPVLVRNPEFLEYILKKIIKSKYKEYNIPKIDFELENKAYYEFIDFKNKKNNGD